MNLAKLPQPPADKAAHLMYGAAVSVAGVWIAA